MNDFREDRTIEQLKDVVYLLKGRYSDSSIKLEKAKTTLRQLVRIDSVYFLHKGIHELLKELGD